MKRLHTCKFSLSEKLWIYWWQLFHRIQAIYHQIFQYFFWITVITRCHHYSPLAVGVLRWGSVCDEKTFTSELGWENVFLAGAEEDVWVLVFRVVGVCLAPRSWIEIVFRGHSRSPSVTTRYGPKPPLYVLCGARASLFQTSYFPPMEGLHKRTVWNSYQVAWDPSTCGPSIWGTILNHSGFTASSFFLFFFQTNQLVC